MWLKVGQNQRKTPSYQGFPDFVPLYRVSQYTSQAYFDLTKEYGIIPSMSRRGNCYDNAMAENFFSILKTECIYRHQATTFEDARTLIDNYIYFYNNQRIQLKTGVAPLTLRHSA